MRIFMNAVPSGIAPKRAKMRQTIARRDSLAPLAGRGEAEGKSLSGIYTFITGSSPQAARRAL